MFYYTDLVTSKIPSENLKENSSKRIEDYLCKCIISKIQKSVTWWTVKLVNQKFELSGACVLEEYSTESRGSANFSEVSIESSASFSKEVPKNNNSNSTAGQ